MEQSSSQSSTGRGRFAILPLIMLPVFIAVSDQTLVATALPAMGADLGSVELLSWVVVAFLISTTLTTPVYGRLGDMIGRRRMLVSALVLVAIGSVICVAAPSMEILILGRAVQGLGAGGLMTISQALVGQLVPLRDRGNVQGYLGAVSTAATVAGPLLGGLITEYFGWRTALALTLPFTLFAVVLALRLPKTDDHGSAAGFDAKGLFFFTWTILPFLLAVYQLQNIHSVGLTPLWFAMLGISLCGLVLLVRQERRARQPLFPLQLLQEPTIWRSSAVAACHGAAITALVAYMPLYLRLVHGFDAGMIGLMLLTLTAGNGLMALIIGRSVSRTGHTAIFPSVGMSALCILVLAFGYFSSEITAGYLPIFYFLISLCFGTIMGIVQMMAQHVAGPAQLGAAASAVQVCRSLGALIGTSVVGALIFSGLQMEGGVGLSALASDEAFLALDKVTAATAFNGMFVAISALAALGAFFAWTIPARSMFERGQE